MCQKKTKIEKMKENKNKDKKAALMITWVISIIILAVGFTLLIMFFYSVDWRGNIDDEVCHQSVIFRATAPGLTKEYLPLKCKTDKICITDRNILQGKADCSNDFGKISGIKNVRVSNVKEVEALYAEEILNCWTMMGEGKVDLFYQDARVHGFGTVYPSCVICSRIAFDNDLKLDLSGMDVEKYMREYKVPGQEISYMQYIGGERGLIDVKKNLITAKEDFTVPDVETGKVGKVEVQGDTGGTIETDDIDDKILIDPATGNKETLTSELAIMFMQITAPEGGKVLSNTLEGLGLASGFGFAVSPKVMGPVILKTLTSPWTWAVIAIAGVSQQGAVYRNRAITMGYCGDVEVGDRARGGCSVVRTVNYNAADISQYCKNIESIP